MLKVVIEQIHKQQTKGILWQSLVINPFLLEQCFTVDTIYRSQCYYFSIHRVMELTGLTHI